MVTGFLKAWPDLLIVLIDVFFLCGAKLICPGITGVYLGRIFDEVKGRPLYLVELRWGFDRPQTIGATCPCLNDTCDHEEPWPDRSSISEDGSPLQPDDTCDRDELLPDRLQIIENWVIPTTNNLWMGRPKILEVIL